MIKQLFFIVLVILVFSCSLSKKNIITPTTRSVFKNTSLWKVSKVLLEQNEEDLSLFFEQNPELIDFQEPRFKQTILEWLVQRNLLSSAELLLKMDADPNIQSRDGTYSTIHAAELESTTMLKLLLKHGASPDSVAIPKPVDAFQKLRTPLIVAATNSLKHVKILVEAGANINYTETKFGMQNALVAAFKSRKMDVINYLIMEKKIDIDLIKHVDFRGDSVEVRTYMRDLAFPLDSEDYKKKMELVNYFLVRKINYWEYPVPRELYHNFSSEYLKQY